MLVASESWKGITSHRDHNQPNQFVAMMLSRTLLVIALTSLLIVVRGEIRGARRNVQQEWPTHNKAIEQHEEQGHRDLGLLKQVCRTVGNFLPGKSTCTCVVDNLVVDFDCQFNSEVCKDGDATVFCTVPTVTGSFNIFKFLVTMDICTSNAIQGGVSVPAVCVTVGGNLFKGLFGGFNSRVFADSVEEGNVKSCSVRIGDEECEDCQVCDNGHGYRFSCAEFDESMVQSTCVQVDGFFGDKKDLQFLPDLD